MHNLCVLNSVECCTIVQFDFLYYNEASVVTSCLLWYMNLTNNNILK